MARLVRRLSPVLRIVVFALVALLLFSLNTPVSADGEIGNLIWKAATASNSPSGNDYPVIAFSADGTKLAMPMGFNQVGIFNAATGELQMKLSGHTDIVRQVAFSSDGKWLVTGGEDTTVRIWRADANFAHHKTLTTHTDKVTGLSFSSDSAKMLSSGKDGKMLIWDTTAWTSTALADTSPTARDGSVISPNGSWAAARYSRTVKVWSVAANIVVKTYDVGSGGVSAFALAWKPDSTTLAVAVYRAVNLYTVQGSDNPTAVAADTIGYSMAFSPDNKYLAVGSGTTSARLYDPGNGYAQYTRNIAGGTGLAFSPDSTRMTAASSGVFRVYDPTSATSQVIAGPIYGESFKVAAIAPSADGQSVFVAGSANYVEERKASDGTSLRTMLIGTISQVRSLALSPDGNWLAVGGSNGKVVVLNAQTGAVSKTLDAASMTVAALDFDPTSTKLLTGSYDKLVKIWDFLAATPTSTILGPPSTHEGNVTGAAYTLDGSKIVTIGSDSVIKVWNTAGDNLLTTDNLGSSLTAMALSPDGTLVAAGNSAGVTKLFSTATGAEVRAMTGAFSSNVNELTFTPDGAYLIGVGLMDYIVLWDVATGAVAGSATKACTIPAAVALARGSSTMVVGGDDGVGAWTLTLGVPRADLSARSSEDAGYTGTGIVNDTGAGQIVTEQASADIPATYYVKAANNYYENDTYTLQGPAGGDGWTVAYYDGNDTNITDDIVNGAWMTGLLEPGLTKEIRVVVTPDNTVVGLTKSLAITATSQLDPTAEDVVKLNTISPVGPGATTRVSIHTDGSEGDADSQYPAVNTDGTRVAFQSDAATLVDDDTNGMRDIFVRKRDTGETVRVSLGAGGIQANGDSWAPAINGDGTVVAFVSDATNLAANDTNITSDIFVRDTAAGVTERVSVTAQGEEANGPSYSPAISADGSLVVFISEADNLVAGDTNACADVFLYDRALDTITRVSVNSQGAQANAACRDAEISADGMTVAFSSLASNLATGDANDTYDIFVVTPGTGAVTCASRSMEGAFGDDGSFLPKLNADGRYVAFTTRATNLLLALGGGGDTNGKQDVYLCDLQGLFGPTLTLVSTTALEQGNGDSGQFGLDIAQDGDTVYVAFESTARNLLGVDNDTNNKGDIFLWAQGGSLSRQSVSTLGDQANEVSRHPAISGDASIIGFDSRASNLVADDTNEAYDVFVHVRGEAWQPDLLISSSLLPETFTGENVFTLNAEQTLDVAVKTAVEATYYVKLKNSALNPLGSFTLKAPAADPATGWTLKYEDGGVNVTAAITGAGWPINDMAPGDEKTIVVKAKTYASSPEAEPLTVQMTATSVDDVSRRDVVQAVLRLSPYQTIMASVNSSGGGISGDDVGFSANGRYVCFVSSGIQVHDRLTGITARVDVASDGTPANNNGSDEDISGDGRYVIFNSTATNLVADDLGGIRQIFMKDRQTGVVILVSRANGVNGAPADSGCDGAVISPNGRYVAFISAAKNLVTVPDMSANTHGQVYLRDVVNGTTVLMSRNGAGEPANAGCSSSGINSTGMFVTWRSTATNLVDLNNDDQYNATDDGNSAQDVFLHDVAGGVTELISVKYDGTTSGDAQSSRDYRSPVSDDGRYVAFSSLATNLIDQQPAIGGKRQIFLRDRQLGNTILISHGANGDPAAADCERPTISLNGRYVGFSTNAVLLPYDDNTLDDVYIVDRDTPGAAGLDLVSVPYNYNGATHTPLSNMKAQDPFISGDGRYIAFEGVTQADTTNLVPTNPGYTGTGGTQIYVRDRWQLAPDLMVKLQGGADWTGEGTIDANVTPAQTLAPAQTNPGATTTFALRLVNSGTTTDDIAVTGTGGGQGWTVQYLDGNENDVTAAVTGDGLLTQDMATNDVVTLTCVVMSDPFTLTGSQLDVVVTATSQRNTATRDRVKASARIAGAHKADLQIRTTADEAFLGDNVYDDGTEQTKTQAVLGGKAASYVVRIENDGGSGDDSYKLWAQQPGAGWTAIFRSPDGTDITEGITNPNVGWTTDDLAMGDFVDIRVTVTPDRSLGGGAFEPILISAQSWNDGTAADAVVARTQVAVLRQPDLIITAPGAQPVGDGVYDDGAAQTVASVVQRGSTVSYAVTLRNDGNVTESLPVLGTASDANWTILYTETTGGAQNDVTLAVATGAWQPLLGMGESATLRVDVTPRLGMAVGVTKTVTLQAVSPGDAKKKDTVVAEVTSAVRKPDLLIQVAGAPLFTGDDAYAPTEQTAAQSVDNEVAAAYPVKLQNDGNTDDTYTLTMPADAQGWTYRLYLGTDTTTNITDAVRAGTWETTLAAGAELDLLVHVIPDAALLGGTRATGTLTAASTNEPAYTDVVTMTTTVAERHQGDALIQQEDEAAYVGDNQYAGVSQVKALPIRAGAVATYRVKVENDGNVEETFALFGDTAAEGWMVTYTDEATGTPITTALTGAGLSVTLAKGMSATYLITVSADPELGSGALNVTRLTVKIGNVTHDVVTAQTQLTGATGRVSVDSLGAQGNNESPSLNSPAAISADGRYVVFSSDASNLVVADTNSRADVFIHDRVLGTTTRVSVSSGGAQANGASDMPAISPDGRYVAFRSAATNLVAGDTNSKKDVFLHDRETGTTIRVSVKGAATQATGDSGAYGIGVSTGGQYVVFESEAANLVTGDTNYVADIFLRDVANGQTLLISAGLNGAAANNRSQNPAMSADGRYIVYGSYAGNLVTGDTNNLCDVFLYDRALGTTTRVSKLGATQGNGNSDDPAISGDGAFIAYITMATNLASGDTNGTWDVMRVSRLTGITTRVSAGGNGASTGPALNGDGRFVAYRSYATNLVSGDTNGKCDAYVYDANGARNYRASLTGNGMQGNADSAQYGVALDSQGYIIAFDSLATNLVPGDTNSRRDVFTREWPAFQPDLLVRKAGDASWLGGNIFYTDAAQTSSAETPPTLPITYEIAVANTGFLTDTYQLTMTSAIQAGWAIEITDSTGQPVDALEVENGSITLAVEGGNSMVYRVRVTPGTTVPFYTQQKLMFTLASAAFPDRGDTASVVTTRVPTTATLTLSPQTRVLINTPVHIAATPVGSPNVEYSFRVTRSNGVGGYVTTVIQDFSTLSTCSWIADATGYATVNVYVREVGQSRTGKASASILVVPPVTDVTLTANRPFPQPAGTPITFTATAVGGTTPIYQYELSRYDPVTRTWRAFYQVRAFNISRTFTLTPTLPGDLRLRVNVRESGQPGILATKDLDFTIVPALSAVDVQASPYPGTVGVPVTVTANPTGGMTPEYRFFCYVMDWEGNIVEQELRGYEASNTTSFIPTTDHVGTVTLTVLAREQGSTAAYAVKGSISYRIYSATDTQPDVLLAANHASPQPAGTSWTFTATAVHIQNPIYQYELSRYQPDTGTWRAFYQVRAFNTSPTFTLTPVIPGDLRMRVNVRESGRPDVLATADMDFTVLPATP